MSQAIPEQYRITEDMIEATAQDLTFYGSGVGYGDVTIVRAKVGEL
tara:strand:- start:2135 stop:2272 length:138 start_codon:yes stop_codon:yes gene_type:complete